MNREQISQVFTVMKFSVNLLKQEVCGEVHRYLRKEPVRESWGNRIGKSAEENVLRV